MLNSEQQAAVDGIVNFLTGHNPAILGDELPFILLVGPAGTGKTFCMKSLPQYIKGRLLYTAPTNKATKVLRDTLTDDHYKPECCTIYSALGLKMETNGEVKEIAAPKDPIDLSKYLAVVVDEAFMVNAQVMGYIKQTAQEYGIAFIFMGDPYQLPPVKESHSPVEAVAKRLVLTKVMRHDNAILNLATAVRNRVAAPFGNLDLPAAWTAEAGGVRKLASRDLEVMICNSAGAGEFFKPGHTKVVAWRNATVDRYNRIIRQSLFENPTPDDWYVTDRLVMLGPASNLDGDTIATTDDEGTVMRVAVKPHPVHSEFQCYALGVTFDDNRTETVWLLHPQSRTAYLQRVEAMAAEARMNRRKWKDFWSFKESFHEARHGYAITAHRSQGSTYHTVFVDYKDILANGNRSEALRCLYVAVTRAKYNLFLA